MIRLIRKSCWSFVILLLINDAFAADKRSADLGFTLIAKRQFSTMPDNQPFAQCSAVSVNKNGQIYLFHRGVRPILCMEANGKILQAWGDDLIKTAHGLRIDREGDVWVTDVGSHKVLKFSPEGKLLLTLGTGEPGNGNDQFNQPTDIAFGLKDEVYISDGYGNSRVVKFHQKGQFIATWGSRGEKPGEFHLPHSIIVDSAGRVLVGDRENNRIQVFDADGKWLAQWRGFAPYGMAFDADDRLFVADGRAAQILLIDDQGKVRKRWGQQGEALGEFQMPHMLGFDPAGNLYVAEVDGKRFQRLDRKAVSKR